MAEAISFYDGRSDVEVSSANPLPVTSVAPTPSATTAEKAEDAASASGDVGVPAMAIQKATPANTAADGDYVMLQMSGGKLWAAASIDQTTPGTTNGVALTQIGSTTAAAGNGVVGAGVQRVAVASDNTPFGVKIDQTTPGTTNLVYVQGSRPFVVKGTFSNGQTTYGTAGLNYGGLVTVATGLPVGTIITALTIRVKALNTVLTTAGLFGIILFDANPSGSTITDNSQMAIVSADVGKVILTTSGGAASWTASANGSGAVVWTAQLTGPRMAVDGSGNIYFSIAAAANTVFANTTAGNLFYEIDGTY